MFQYTLTNYNKIFFGFLALFFILIRLRGTELADAWKSRELQRRDIFKIANYIPLLGLSFWDIEHQGDEKFQIWALYLPFCSFHEFMKGSTFSFTEISLNIFVAYSVASITFMNVQPFSCSNLIRKTFMISYDCKVLLLKFPSVCHQEISNRKKSVKKCFFDNRHYEYIVGHRNRFGSSDWNFKKKSGIYGSDGKLQRFENFAVCDLSKWRTVEVEEICADGTHHSEESKSFELDSFSGGDPAWQACRSSWKFKLSSMMHFLYRSFVLMLSFLPPQTFGNHLPFFTPVGPTVLLPFILTASSHRPSLTFNSTSCVFHSWLLHRPTVHSPVSKRLRPLALYIACKPLFIPVSKFLSGSSQFTTPSIYHCHNSSPAPCT